MSDYLKQGFIDEVKGCLVGRGGQENVIESIKVNGVGQTVDENKAVNIPVPTKTSDLDNDSGYQTNSEVSSTVVAEVAKIVADAPEDLNTLKEMSDWIAHHEDDASAMNSAISDNKTAISALQTGKADKSEIPTTVAELTDSADYAKKTDIPKTLPANGGNSDKVNNHTVKSDVPENAVFTDTIYDDTEVKGSIEDLSSNLDTLEYSDIAGGKNLIDVSKVIRGEMVGGDVTDGNNYITDFIHLDYGKNYILSNCSKKVHETAWFTQDKTFVQRTFGVELTPPTNDCYYARIEYDVEQGINAQLEEGTQATQYEPYIPSVKMIAEEVGKQNDSLDVIGKCKNLLNPTLQTTTKNGVTCTANGDGTYTLNGTATQNTSLYLYILEQDWEVGKTYRIVGCPSGGSRNSYFVSPFYGYSSDSLTDYGNGCTFTVTDDVKSYTAIIIFIIQGFTCNNIVFKPMLTTNLNATYDDFVPYTGDGDTLTADVAEIKNDLGGLTFSASGTTLSITNGTNTWTLEANS